MGNSVTTQEHKHGFDAYIWFTNGITKNTYSTLYEFDEMSVLIDTIKRKYRIDRLNIASYNKYNHELIIHEYKDAKNVRVVRIRSFNKRNTMIALNEIRKMLKWVYNHNIELLRPRIVIPCTYKEHIKILGRRKRGFIRLCRTERNWHMYIKYKKRYGGIVVCSGNNLANLRIKAKIKTIQNEYKINSKKKSCPNFR